MIVESLYPEVANLYGEQANVRYLKQSCNCTVIETSLNEKPAFLSGEKVDLVYLGTLTERGQELVVERLKPFRDDLVNAIEKGQRFLVTGNALEVFGSGITDLDTELMEDGASTFTECLDIFHFHTERRMLHRFNSLYHGKFVCSGEGEKSGIETDIVGFKSQFTQSYWDEKPEPLFSNVRGEGFGTEKSGEGIWYRNFMATYIIGPLLVVNPPFTKWLMEECGVGEPRLAMEDASMDAYRQRLREYSEPDRGFVY